jgi:hypothetical protein
MFIKNIMKQGTAFNKRFTRPSVAGQLRWGRPHYRAWPTFLLGRSRYALAPTQKRRKPRTLCEIVVKYIEK